MATELDRFVFFDVETSGLDPNVHEIIEFAAVATDEKLNPLSEFHHRILFDESNADPTALEINHYDPALWAEFAIAPEVAVVEIAEFLKTWGTYRMVSQRTGANYYVSQLAGHNARFDFDFLAALFKRNGGAFLPARFIPLDTVQAAAWFVAFGQKADPEAPDPENLKLGTLMAHWGLRVDVPGGKAHEATYDVYCTIALARKILGVAP